MRAVLTTEQISTYEYEIKMTTVGLVLGFATSALALDKAALDNRIRQLTAKLEAMQQKPDRCIPPETLRKAHGIILIDRTKAGLVFAYPGGSGVIDELRTF